MNKRKKSQDELIYTYRNIWYISYTYKYYWRNTQAYANSKNMHKLFPEQAVCGKNTIMKKGLLDDIRK